VQTNLLTYSQDFDNAAWTQGNVTATANSTTAPDGTTTADTITPTTTSATHAVLRASNNTVIANQPLTVSVFVKPNGYNFITIRLDDGGGFGLYAGFNVSTGVISTAVTGFGGNWSSLSANISSVGNGWYRCSITGTPTGTVARTIIYVDNAVSANGATYAGNGTSGAFLWGAQLVQGAVAGDYRRTDAAALPVFYPNHNGVVCAEKLVEDTATSAHFLQSATLTAQSGTTYTFSCYAKAAERSRFELLGFALSLTGRGFDLSNGTTFANTAGLSEPTAFSITSVGNGWYRCSITAIGNGLVSTVRAYLNNGTTFSYAGNGSSGIYIFGAQLSDSASLDPYVLNAAAAPTAAAYYGPRFDYDPVTLQPKGLLIEEQRTNLATYSEDFSNAAWIKQRLTVSQISEISPNGNLTSSKLIEDTSASITHQLASVQAFVSGAVTISFYAKKGANFSPTQLGVILYSGTGTDQTVGGTFSGAAAWTGASAVINQNITAATLTTSWVRYSYTGNVASTATQLGLEFALTPVGTAGADDYIYITGVQIEVGSVATQFSRAGATIQGELAACQRYYEKSYDQTTALGTATFVGAGGGAFGTNASGYSVASTYFKVTKRSAPTITSYDTSGNSGKCSTYASDGTVTANKTPGIDQIGVTGFRAYENGTTKNGLFYQWVADSEL